eukprot:gene22047-28540_t
MSENCLIVDNGAGRIKYGLYNSEISYNDYNIKSIPNCSARIHKQMQILIGEEIDNFHNGSLLQYTRPFDRGYLNNWPLEIDIWRSLLDQTNGSLNIKDINNCSLIMTEPFLNPDPWQNDTNEVLFELFVIDSGFSFSHATPYINNIPILHAIKRVNVGGKLLTNFLKETVSYRQWNMMDEFKLMDQVKEELCFISKDFKSDFKALRNKNKSHFINTYNRNLKQHFVLPDFQNIMRGFVKPDDQPINTQQEQVLVMESERFCVPELLFHPSDIGIEMAGIAEATWQSLRRLDELDIGLCSRNIILTGGNCKFSNFHERYVNDLRPFIPDLYDLNVTLPEDSENFAWRGAYNKAQYLEYGNSYCNEKFKSALNT